MLQAVVKKGKVVAEKVPTPNVSEGCVLIKVVNSCISAGTEMSSVSESGKSLIKRAMEQPEQVKEVLNFLKSNGLQKTIARIKGTIEGGKPTGYSISGIVLACGAGVKSFKPGDRVAAAGAGLANHAEYVDVPENLVMSIPQNLSFEEASTVTLGGIAMQGVRRAELNLGEFCVIIGAGILGLLALQMLKAAGVRVIVTDVDDSRLAIAKELGAEMVLNPTKLDPVKEVENITGGYGTDAVIFTAATSSNEPLSQAFRMCKRKGRVILVGVSGMEIKRGDIYAKELDFLVSTSYGPGRYDNNYEGKGLDYPYSYVRWTENRNMTEYLRLVDTGSISLAKMINATFSIEKVEEAYASLTSAEKPIITILDYGMKEAEDFLKRNWDEKKIIISSRPVDRNKIKVAVVGVGGFATGVHLPNLQNMADKYEIYAIMNRTGQKAKAVATQFGAKYATSDYEDILKDEEVDLIMICTRHGNHAELALKGLQAGKNVFVEKPLAINEEELQPILDFYEKNKAKKDMPLLMTGFNRRFSVFAQEIKKYTKFRVNPLFIHYRMNAGFIPLDHWVHEDGGRIIGEGCHIIDLMTFLTESKLLSVSYQHLSPSNTKYLADDNVMMCLKYEDGSVANIHYFATGSKAMSKEYMEVHFDEKTIVMDDYKTLSAFGMKINNPALSISQKGQKEELLALYDALKGKSSWPIELWDMAQTTQTTFLIRPEQA